METEIGWCVKEKYDDKKKQRYEELKKSFEEEMLRRNKPRAKSIKCISYGSYGDITDTADYDKYGTTEKERSGAVSCHLYKFYKDHTVDGFTEEGFRSDMERYHNDMKRSDGFDVGVYPHRRASLLMSPNFLTPTYYDSVNVLKAMNFGCAASNYNITFQASLPPAQATTFQTRVLTLVLFRVFQIVFVRKLNNGDDEYQQANSLPPSQDVDFIGEQQNHSDQDDDDVIYSKDVIDTNIYTPYTDSGFKLPLYLSQFALLVLNQKQLHLNMDKLLQTVNVLDTKKSLLRAPEEGAAYLITFEAFLPYKSIIQTQIYLSPLVPPATIKIKYVKFLHPTDDHRALLW